MQRNKGAAYEREVAHEISRALDLPTPLTRKLGQARDSGNDLDVGPLAIECKRRSSLTTLENWMDQAEQAVAERRVPFDKPIFPAVVMRADNCESMIAMRLADFLLLARDPILKRMREDV